MEKLTISELQFARDYEIIDTASIRMQIEDMEKQKYLAMHPYEVFESGGSWWTYFPDEVKGRVQKKRKRKEDIEKLIIDFYQEQTMNPSIEEVFYEWNYKLLKDGDIKQSTFDRNEDYYKRHFAGIEKKKVKSISVSEWADFLKGEVHSKKLKRKAYDGLHQIVFHMLKHAKVRGYIDFRISEIDEYITFGKNVFRNNEENIEDAELEKEISDEKEVFSEEETELILEYLVSNLDKLNLGILTEFVTGIRVGETASLKNTCVRDNFIMVRHSETRGRIKNASEEILSRQGTVLGKTHYYAVDRVKTATGIRDCVVPEGCEWICEELRKLNPDGVFVFESEDGRMTANCFRRRLERICKKLKIVPKSPHKIRKTYASILRDAKVDDNLTKKQMGHTDISLTEDKYHRDRKTKITKAKVLGEIKDFELIKKSS